MFKPRGHRRIRLPQFNFKRRRPLAFRQVFMISFIIFLGLTVWGLWLINEGIKPTLMAFAVTKTQNVATKVINTAVNKQVKEFQQNLNFVTLKYNNDGDVSSAVINAADVNMLQTTTTNQVINYLKMLENGKPEEFINSEGIELQADQKGPLITTIPLGLATKNSLLANLGPQVPVRFQLIGNVKSNLEYKVDAVGINTTSISMYIHIVVNIRAIIPFATKPKKVSSDVFLTGITYPADTPLYYGGNGNGGNAPSIVLPPSSKKGNQPKKQTIKIPGTEHIQSTQNTESPQQ
ncbi:MAG TPA: sporulation protein YunB [Bacillales bacterium]|nr:sporulation protein YunB [Bacillales bacterium]